MRTRPQARRRARPADPRQGRPLAALVSLCALLAAPAAAQNFAPTSIAGCVLWLDGNDVDGDGAAEGAAESGLTGVRLDTWVDKAGGDHNALRQSGTPTLATNAFNGGTVVRFTSPTLNPGDSLRFNRITTMRTVFWVVQETNGTSSSHFLLGDDNNSLYDFHRGGANGAIWNSTYAHANVRNGTTRLNGAAVDGTTTPIPPNQFVRISLVTAGNAQANQVTQDRIYHGSWQGEIAEIIVYTTVLGEADRERVERYLVEKWFEPGRPAIRNDSGASNVTTTSAWLTGELLSTGASETVVIAHWGPADGGTAAVGWAQAAVLGAMPPGLVSLPVSNLPHASVCHYRLAASNAAGLAWADTTARFLTDLDPAQFAHRMAIPARGYGANETLENFPLLVRLREEHAFFRYADVALPAGGDLRFADAGGIRTLRHEIEAWNPAGDSLVWVQVPELRAGAAIWAYWGDPALAAPVPGAASPFAGEAAGVWHLGEAAADGALAVTNHADATPHGNTGVQYGNVGAPGAIGGAQEFSTGDYVRVPAAASLNLTTQATLSAWVKLNAYATDYSLVAMKGDTGGSRNYGLWVRNNGNVLFSYAGGGLQNLEAGGFTLGAWHHLAAVVDPAAGVRRIYINGVLRNATTGVLPALTPNALDLYVGGRAGSWLSDGILDEVRVESAARSSNWVWACWANQVRPEAFAPCGAGWPLPGVETTGAAEVTFHSATLLANLWSTGAAPTRVRAYLGPQDGGNNPTAWARVYDFGLCETGALALVVGGLVEDTNYYHRVEASNVFGSVWASATSGVLRTRVNVAALAGTNFIGMNMDFEDITENLSVLPGWRGDGGTFASIGDDGLVTPHHGSFMFRTGGTGGGTGADLYQDIALDRFVDAITNGNVQFRYHVRYNRVADSFAPGQVDTEFNQELFFYDAAGALISGAEYRNKRFTDNLPGSWETATHEGLVPPNAVRLHTRLFWWENIFPNGSNEFPGNYTDNAEIMLILPGSPPAPTGALLIVR